jgi:protein SCO1/2
MTPEWLNEREAGLPSTHRVAAFQLTDQSGNQVTDKSLAAHVTVAHFFFTKCGDICPTTTRNLARTLEEVPRDNRLQILSYSVSPERDSLPELRAFATKHHITDSRWHLLTGDTHAIESLARNSYFVRLGKDTTYGVASIAHTESLILVDGKRRLRGVYAGSLPLETERLREDILTLLRESSAM